MLPTIQLYSAYFKPFPIVPQAPFIKPIQSGAAIQKSNPDTLMDNTGENISSLNPMYSELTTCYWIFKNAPRNTDAWGLCHYRRYFIATKYKIYGKKRSRFYFKASQENVDKFVTEELYNTLQTLLQNHDVIVQRPDYTLKKGCKSYTIEQSYTMTHIKNDWDTTMQVIREKYPSYAASINVLSQQKRMFYNNMMIARWNIWDNYLSWLFDILFEVQKRIDLPKTGYQSRVFGFLAERLHNLFVLHNRLKPAYATMGILVD